MNKFVLRFSGSSVEYDGVFGPDNLPDNNYYIKILDGTRPIEARMFMSNAQYNALPDDFKACNIDQTQGLCAIQLTSNSLDITDPSTGFSERTIQTSYCFMLVSAQVVSSGIDSDVREIRLASVQQLWNKATIFCAYNTRSNYADYPEDDTDLSELTARQVILDAVIAQINSSLRYGATIAPPLPNKSYTASGFSAQKFMPPVNFVCQYEPADKAIRRLIDPCGYNFIFNPWKSSLGAVAAGDFTVVNITGTDDNLDDVESLLEKGRCNGASTSSTSETWGNWNTPGVIRFIYQQKTTAFVETSGNAIIGYSDSTNSGGKSWVTLPVYANEYKSGDCFTWWKGQTLEAIAGRTGTKPRIWQLVGAYTLTPGKSFRSIYIDYSKTGVFTQVVQHGYIEPEGKREYGITISPEDYNIVTSSSSPILDRRADGTIDINSDLLSGVNGTIMFTHPDADWYSTSTILLTPCDISGVDTGADDITVDTEWRTLFPLLDGSKIEKEMIIPVSRNAEGDWKVIGSPKYVLSDIVDYYDEVNQTGAIRVKAYLDFGIWRSSISNWIDKIDIGPCA